jgi:hypothetical protein
MYVHINTTQHNMFLSRACRSVQREHNQQHLKRKASAPDNTSSSSRKFCIFQTNRSPHDLKHTIMCQHGFLQNRCSTANKMYNLYTNLSCAAKLLCTYRLSEHLDQIPHINLKLLCHGCKHYLWSNVAHVEQYKKMHTHTHTYIYIYPWGCFNYQPMDMNIGQMYGKLQIIENVQWHSCNIPCISHVSKACKIWQDEEIQHFQTKHMSINYTKWLLDNNILIVLSSLTSYHMFNLV